MDKEGMIVSLAIRSNHTDLDDLYPLAVHSRTLYLGRKEEDWDAGILT